MYSEKNYYSNPNPDIKVCIQPKTIQIQKQSATLKSAGLFCFYIMFLVTIFGLVFKNIKHNSLKRTLRF